MATKRKTGLVESKMVKRDGKIVEVFSISNTGADLLETTLKNMGLDPNDKNMPMPNMAEFTKAINVELAKRKLRVS